ncbi:hypothetical protein BGZ50_009473, partial [Haplosporangium sp. Z 11]
MIVAFRFAFSIISGILSLLKFLLVGALGALLSLYAKRGNVYANSIRWSRHGGYLEMTISLWNSIGHVPRSATAAMAVVIFANLASMFVSVGLGGAVNRLEVENNKSFVVSKSKHISLILQGDSGNGWSTFMGQSSTIEDTLTSIINNPQNIPDAVPGLRYRPRRYGYQASCNRFNAIVIQNSTKDGLVQKGDGCAMVALQLLDFYIWDPKLATNERISDDRFKIVAHANAGSNIAEMRLRVGLIHDDRSCMFYSGYVGKVFLSFPPAGMTTLPVTEIHKCQYPSGEMLVSAATHMRFYVGHLRDFNNVTSTIFDNRADLSLLGAMEEMTRNGTFLDPARNSTMVVLTKLGPTVDFLSCASWRMETPGDTALMCSYTIIHAITVGPQPEDSIIAAAVGPRIPDPVANVVNDNRIHISHLPSGSSGLMATFSISKIIEVTSGATHYMASLGQNLVMGLYTQELHILFDTTEVKEGVEISTALSVVVAVIMLICASFWGYTEKYFSPTDTGSLYK